MKKRLIGAMALGCLLAFAAQAGAVTIQYGPVVAEDILTDWTKLGNSGDATEAAWIANALGVDPDEISFSKLPLSDGSAWIEVEGEAAGDDLWAFDFGASSYFDYFLVKMGSNTGVDGEVGLFDAFLYENTPSIQYGVIDLEDFYRLAGAKVKDIDIFRVSHVATTSQVPEPGTLLLLGSGLLGLGLMRRRKTDA